MRQSPKRANSLILAWLKALPLLGKIGLGVAALIAVISLIKIADDRHENALEAAADAGRAEAIAEAQDTTLGQVKDAKNAVDEIRNDAGFARFCGCVRNSAKGFAANCEREIKDRALLDDVDAALAACRASPR